MSISIREAATVTPSARQLAWQKLKFYGFIHFTVNTFTDREWGDGTESPDIFHPTELDARQWAQACHAAGMKGLILTCKHHDGFCLWPSQYTDHSVRNSPWRQGQGDLVREVSEACREYGLKFGIYLSPWDRHERSYGDYDAYNDYFVQQLKELLTGYGDIFSVWFDGACGEGPNGKRQVYNWDRYYDVIRRHQPQAVISVCGPDVRWCGNEAGHTRTSEWSVVPASMRDNEKIQEKSQMKDDAAFASRINSDEDDLGSREVIAKADELIWYPAEVNTSIRPGWFYHRSEDNQVKDTDTLMELYERAVGGNSCFLLNLPPDRRGLIHENDVQTLQELGERIAVYDDNDLALHTAVQVTEFADSQPVLSDGGYLTDGREDTWWQSAEGAEQAIIELDLGQTVAFDRVVLMEHIASGQRIEQFTVDVFSEENGWQAVHAGTVVGYKCICRLAAQQSRYIRISIVGSRWCPTLQSVSVFDTKRSR